jgi:hypothetical protein
MWATYPSPVSAKRSNVRVFVMWLHSFRVLDDWLARWGFGTGAPGNPTGMQQSDSVPDDVPDDVPVADAVEQQRTPVEPTADEEASAEPPEDVPLEASAADWQEQLETVELDPDEGRVDE